MIKTEMFYISNAEMVRTYSDRGMKIHGGSPEADYDEAIDPTEFSRTYTETDIPIESDEDPDGLGEKAIGVADALLGE